MMKVLALVLELLVAALYVSGSDWSYRGKLGVDNWGKVSEKCDVKGKEKSRQSPIVIGKHDLKGSKKLKELDLRGYNKVNPKTLFKIKNNGHAIEVDILPGDEDDYVAVDALQDKRKYVPVGFHFHFGSPGKKGTEHIVKGKKYVMEMHLVHRDKKYEFNKALNTKNGLHVIGVFFELDKEDNPAVQKIVDKLDDVEDPGHHDDLKPFPLTDLFPKDQKKYYRYMGSLTTPPCSEVVVWVLFKDPIKISKKQLQKFRKMRSNEDDKKMTNNIRPTQPIGKRTIYETKD